MMIRLVSHRGIDKLTFTGSTVEGRRVGSICGEQINLVTLELGGKSEAIVLDDANLHFNSHTDQFFDAQQRPSMRHHDSYSGAHRPLRGVGQPPGHNSRFHRGRYGVRRPPRTIRNPASTPALT
jgi:hypothetical protein